VAALALGLAWDLDALAVVGGVLVGLAVAATAALVVAAAIVGIRDTQRHGHAA
jgi:hypothetical protein